MRTPIATASALLVFVFFQSCCSGAAEQQLLKKIHFTSVSQNEERVIFTLNGAYIPKIFAIKGEKPRVVFDFPETKPAGVVKNVIDTNGKFLGKIRLGIHRKPVLKTRIVFDLQPNLDISFKDSFDIEKNELTISLYKQGFTPQHTRPEKKIVKKRVQEKTEIADNSKGIKSSSTPTAAVPVIRETNKKQVDPPPSQTHPVVDKSTPEKPQPASPSISNDANKIIPAEVEEPKEVIPQPVPVIEASDTPAQPEPTKGQSVLTSVTFDATNPLGEMVLLKVRSFQPPTIFGVQEGSPSVVCNFTDIQANDGISDNITANGKYIKNIRVKKDQTENTIKVVLELTADNSYDLQQVFFKEDNLFVIIVNKVDDPKN